MEKNSKKDLLVTLAVLLVIVFIVTGTIVTKKKDPVASTNNVVVSNEQSKIAQPSTTPRQITRSAPPAAAAKTGLTTSSSGYKDGTYSASGQYSDPESIETITVSVTLKDGLITDTNATEQPKNINSKEYVNMFLENYKKLVIGKDISSLNLSRVSGSSLTSQGFNTAIQTIRSQAKV